MRHPANVSCSHPSAALTAPRSMLPPVGVTSSGPLAQLDATLGDPLVPVAPSRDRVHAPSLSQITFEATSASNFQTGSGAYPPAPALGLPPIQSQRGRLTKTSS
jgi:hypothetical protein